MLTYPQNLLVRTYEIAFAYDVLLNGGGPGIITMPRLPIIPANAVYKECFFYCTRNTVNVHDSAWHLETAVEILFAITNDMLAGQVYQTFNDQSPRHISDGSPLQMQFVGNKYTDGAGTFFIRYSTSS